MKDIFLLCLGVISASLSLVVEYSVNNKSGKKRNLNLLPLRVAHTVQTVTGFKYTILNLKRHNNNVARRSRVYENVFIPISGFGLTNVLVGARANSYLEASKWKSVFTNISHMLGLRLLIQEGINRINAKPVVEMNFMLMKLEKSIAGGLATFFAPIFKLMPLLFIDNSYLTHVHIYRKEKRYLVYDAVVNRVSMPHLRNRPIIRV